MFGTVVGERVRAAARMAERTSARAAGAGAGHGTGSWWHTTSVPEKRAVLLLSSRRVCTVITNESSALSTTGVDVTDQQPGVQTARYIRPDAFTRRVFNPVVATFTRWGISLWGSRVLSVPGRISGEIRSTPVNLLAIDDRRYLVAPRGEAQWVRNVRAAGGCELRVGRRTEEVRLDELADADKPDVLRRYLRRWKWEVGQFFDGVGPDATDEELLAAAPKHPVFAITDR